MNPYFSAKAYVVVDKNSIDKSNPDVVFFKREAILENFFIPWSMKMHMGGMGEKISEDNCVMDWVLINSAIPVTIH